MAVLRSLLIDWLGQIKFLDDHTWAHVEIVADDLHELVRAL